ncbi:PepSY domain-containing protein [Streptosporangium minutum]|uniref:Peptidase n=1 Tax=Streptosporangium minutum TaxID=569862 RepID=A0A243RNZ8_9ACTN|nr:PepSY domain-containing protein [Streptosporangium minutum]OUC96697.1 peptidase [Streptosporangium minutum]
MKQIIGTAVVTIGTAALLAGGGGIALAADRAAALSPATAASEIPYQKAAQIARSRVSGGRVTKIERECEHGYAIWKVEVRKDGWEYDIHVSAESGTIVKFKRGSDG